MYKNDDFYNQGKFDEAKAKEAYFEMMEKFGYPIPPNLRENMWATDFSLGRFTEVGMAGIFWINEIDGGYFGHEIYLLPGQMIAEHAHVGTDKAGPKMEGWHVRHGDVYLSGEGAESEEASKIIPASELKFTTVRCITHCTPGEVRKLNRAEAKHFMVAGAEGVIVTEYANYHDGDGLRFTNPGVSF